jgi:Obg family GTPase CgtA-like protein
LDRDKPPVKIFRPRPREPRIEVRKAGGEYLIHAPDLERIIAGAGVTPSELRWQLNMQLNRLGVDKALAKAGAKTGDRVRCGGLTWEWSLPGSEE